MKAVKFFSLILCALLFLLNVPAEQLRANYVQAFPDSASVSKIPKWSTRAVEKTELKDSATGILYEVRVGRQQGFDRVVFEFPKNSEVPTYRVQYITKPIEPSVGSEDLSLKISGRAFLDVHFDAFAHDYATDVQAKEPKNPLGLKLVREIKQREDFENDMAYVLGLEFRRPFRVTELSNPARLVVDIKY